MATLNLVPSGVPAHMSGFWGKEPYRVSVTVDLADAVSLKGSALAAGDVLQVLTLPAGSVILGAGFATVDVPSPGVKATVSVADSLSSVHVTGTLATAGAMAGCEQPPVFSASANTLTLGFSTIKLADGTTNSTITSGKLRLWAIVQDIT